MNIRTLTPDEKTQLFRLICYGRATPANIARAFDIDRRTAQRLTTPEALSDIIPKATDLDLATWYALLDPNYHSWKTADGIWHNEANTAVAVRDDLAFLVKEIIGDDLKKRLVEGCPQVWNNGRQNRPVGELRRLLDLDFSIPDNILRFYHYQEKPVFHDANGVEI